MVVPALDTVSAKRLTEYRRHQEDRATRPTQPPFVPLPLTFSDSLGS